KLGVDGVLRVGELVLDRAELVDRDLVVVALDVLFGFLEERAGVVLVHRLARAAAQAARERGEDQERENKEEPAQPHILKYLDHPPYKSNKPDARPQPIPLEE